MPPILPTGLHTVPLIRPPLTWGINRFETINWTDIGIQVIKILCIILYCPLSLCFVPLTCASQRGQIDKKIGQRRRRCTVAQLRSRSDCAHCIDSFLNSFRAARTMLRSCAAGAIAHIIILNHFCTAPTMLRSCPAVAIGHISFSNS